MKVIAFDVDDTLYDLSEPYRRAVLEFFGPDLGIPLDELFIRSRVCSDEAYELVLAGVKPIEYMHAYRVQMAFGDFGVDVSREDALAFQRVYERYQGSISVSSAVRSLIGRLDDAGITVGVISNGDSDHQWAKIDALGVPDLIPRELIVVSGDIGHCKPEVEIFRALEDRIGFIPDERWFVGDTYENDVIGSLDAGWRCIWFNRRGRILEEGEPRPDLEVRSEDEMIARVGEVLGLA